MIDETYKLWDLIGTWLTGLSTLAAVIVSLLFSMRGRLNLKISAGIKQIITPGIEDAPSYCCIEVVNAGISPVNVTSIAWQVGFFSRDRVRVQIFNNVDSHRLPAFIQEGEIARFMLPIQRNNLDDWMVRFSEELLEEYSKLSIRLTMKICVFTSVGDVFRVKVDKSLIGEIIKNFSK
jgi:hypothetical protein